MAILPKDAAPDAVLVEALDMLLSFESWNRLREDQGLSIAKSKRVLKQAIESLLQSARHIVVRLHPDDHALVQAGAAESIAARGARLVGDASIARGGCRVESDIGGVDATIEERWRLAAAALGCDDTWNGDEAPSATPEPDAT